MSFAGIMTGWKPRVNVRTPPADGVQISIACAILGNVKIGYMPCQTDYASGPRK